MIDAVVLAAGLSSRMTDSNKLLLPYKNKTIVEHVVDELLKSEIGRVVVVIGHAHSDLLNTLKKYPVEFIFNAAYRNGQTTSIQAAMSQLRNETDGFMVCLGDMPMLTHIEYNRLIEFFYSMKKEVKHPVVRPIFKKSIGHPVIFDIAYREAILKSDSTDGCKNVISDNRKDFRPFEVSSLNYFFDVDNKNDYRRLMISSDA